jgi:Glycosyltransferase family 92
MLSSGASTAACACRTKPAKGQVDPYTRTWPNTIAVCAIMKEERIEDVKEFIEYHRWVGVDSFYLRENGEACAIADDLQPYIDAGILDLDVKPGSKHPTQTNWYNECSTMASKSHSWIAFIDLDEFIIVLQKCALTTQHRRLSLPRIVVLVTTVDAACVHSRGRSLRSDSEQVAAHGCTPAWLHGFLAAWRLPACPHGCIAARLQERVCLRRRCRSDCRNQAITEKDSLKTVLHNSFRYTAAVSMQWVLFGSAMHKEMPEEGQLAGFNRCTGLLSKQMKCLGNTYWFHHQATFRPTHVHQCNFR